MKTAFSIYLAIALVLGLNFVYQGLTTTPAEGDSLAYHLPIAQNILQGKFSDFENEADLFDSLLQYYPAASHLILASLVLIGLPQLFNVAGWFAFIASGYVLGLTVRLSKRSAFILGIVLSTLTAAVRLLPTQTIDIWLAVFYTLSLALILLPVKSLKQTLALGVSLGMLIGTKFTGPALAIPLVVLFWPSLRQKHDWRWYLALFTPILILGCSWYLRNWYFRGDLLYPASHPAFALDEWQTWQTVFSSPAQLFRFLQALISEYSIYALLLVAAPVALFSKQVNRLVKILQLRQVLYLL